VPLCNNAPGRAEVTVQGRLLGKDNSIAVREPRNNYGADIFARIVFP
jgi:hypothetical protein